MKLKTKMGRVFSEWKESDLSLRAFGAREGISYSKLQYWKRKFQIEAEPAQSEPDFAQVRIVPDTVPSEPELEVFEVSLANGMGLGIAAGFNEDELRRLIGVLSTC